MGDPLWKEERDKSEETAVQSRGSCETQQEVQNVQERLFTRLDRRGVCGETRAEGRVPTYKVDEWDGTPIKGTFYEQDLQKVTVEDDDLFRIDKVVKRKGDKVLVRWKGWPDKYDTWLSKKDVLTKP